MMNEGMSFFFLSFLVFCEATTRHATMYDVFFAILTFSSKNEMFKFRKMSLHFIAWNEK